MFIVGLGWVSDMTSRRALVFDLVGEALLDKAMAMEAMSLAMGMVFGALVGYGVMNLVMTSTPLACRILRMIFIAASCPSKREAAVTILTLFCGI